MRVLHNALPADKMKRLFKVFDVDDDGRVDRREPSSLKVASWWGHGRPPRVSQAASEGLRLPSALGSRGPAPQIPQEAAALEPRRTKLTHFFRCV